MNKIEGVRGRILTPRDRFKSVNVRDYSCQTSMGIYSDSLFIPSREAQVIQVWKGRPEELGWRREDSSQKSIENQLR
jgi:hypothetical protein